MTCYYYCLAYKDESTTMSVPGTTIASVIDLKSLPPTPSRRAETLHHHQRRQHQPYHKAIGKSTLNKTNEHCRSLFNLLPTSNNKGVDAVSMTDESERESARKKKRPITSYCCFDLCSDTSYIYHQCTYTQQELRARSPSLTTDDRTNWLFLLLYAIQL
jgi:hypothetical protein